VYIIIKEVGYTDVAKGGVVVVGKQASAKL
jgi:hypothetical protein